MEKNKINVVIFDEDEPSSKDQRESRTVHSSKHATPTNQHQLDVIEQEITYLTDKIRALEQQTENLAHIKNESNTNIKNSQLPNAPSPDHAKEILFVIQKKIQIIVRQTKQLVDKLGETFEKKLQNKLTKKYDEYGIGKIKQNYTSQVKKIEEGYQKEIERVNKQFKEAEKQMLTRVNAVQQQLLNRINQYDIKEKEYIDWIHHLEIQLQDKQKQQQNAQQQNAQYQQPSYQSIPQQQPLQQLAQQQQQPKSKKMIEITHTQHQERAFMSQGSSIMSGDQNSSTLIAPKSNIHNQNSRVQRKHRIFDPALKNQSSVSPHNKGVSPNNTKVISPITSQPQQQHMQSSKAINPLTKPRLTQNPPATLKEQMSVNGRMTEPLSGNNTADVQSSPWKAIDKSIEKSYVQPTRRNQIVKDVNEDEFYKDLPRASQGWQKFQDYEENGSSSSDSEEEDVVFYRNEDRKEQFTQKYKQPKWKGQDESRPISNVFGENKKQPVPRGEQKVFSPFDL